MSIKASLSQILRGINATSIVEELLQEGDVDTRRLYRRWILSGDNHILEMLKRKTLRNLMSLMHDALPKLQQCLDTFANGLHVVTIKGSPEPFFIDPSHSQTGEYDEEDAKKLPFYVHRFIISKKIGHKKRSEDLSIYANVNGLMQYAYNWWHPLDQVVFNCVETVMRNLGVIELD